MKLFFAIHKPLLACGLLALGQCSVVTADEPGVVRISDTVIPASATSQVIEAAPVGYLSPHHPRGEWYMGHPPQHHGGVNNPLFPPKHPYAPAPRHNPYQNDYFHAQQRGGQGLPRTGYYSGAYPVNPWYSDPRDSRIYAAGATGVPTSVPLAPNVEHTYNYGWGIPSSRLTPLSIMPPDARRSRK